MTKKSPLRAFFLLSCFFLCFKSVFPSEKNEIPEAKELLLNYLTAALSNNGDAAVDCLSKQTFQKWDEILEYARTADKTRIDKLRLYEQFAVLWIRHKIEASDLRTMHARKYISFSYSMGFNSKNALYKFKALTETHRWHIRKIDTNGYAFYLINDEWKRIAGLRLLLEDGQWKIDGVDQIMLIEQRLHSLWKTSGKSKENFIDEFFFSASGKHPDSSLWQPRF